MADGAVTLNAGSGGSDIDTRTNTGGEHRQVVVLGEGAATSDELIPGDGTNGLLVNLGSNNDVTVTGAALTALQLIDNPVVVDDAAFTPGTTSVSMAGATFDDTTPDSVDEGDAGALRMSARRELYVQLRDAAGNERGLNVDTNGDIGITNSDLSTIAGAVSGSEMQVDVVASLPAGTNAIGKLAANSGVDIGDVDVLSLPALAAGANTIGEVTIGAATTAAGDLAKAEDAAHSSGDVGVMALGIRDTSPAAVSGTDGDFEPPHISDDGGLWVSQSATHQGGNSFFSSIDLDQTEEEVSGSACTVAYMYFWNATAAPLWVQIFDDTAASIAPGTDAPDINFPIPANADSDVGGVIVPIPQGGIQFSTALSVAVTTGSGTNSGAPGANEAGGIIIYKA